MGYVLALALVVGIEDSAYDTEEQEQHQKFAPDALPEGWAHFDRQFCYIFAPYAMRVGGSHFEYIVAMADTVKADDIAASVRNPLARSGITIDAIEVLGLILAFIVERSKGDGQVSLIGWNHYFFLVQDRLRLFLSAIVEGTEDDLRLVVTLLQRSRIEGNQSHRGTYRDVVACRVVVWAAVRERHVEVEIVRSEHVALARFRVYAVDARFSDHPDSSLVVFYHALYDAFVYIDGMEVFHLQVVLQERFVHNLFHHTALLRDIHLSAGMLHDVVHIVCCQTCGIVRYVVGLVIIDFPCVCKGITEGDETVCSSYKNGSRSGAADAAYAVVVLLLPRQSVPLADKADTAVCRLINECQSASVGTYPDASGAVGYDVEYLVEWQRGRIVRVIGKVPYLHLVYQINTVTVGSNPCSSLDIEVDGVDARFGEVYLLWHNLSAWRKVSDTLVGGVEYLDYSIVIACPDMSVW